MTSIHVAPGVASDSNSPSKNHDGRGAALVAIGLMLLFLVLFLVFVIRRMRPKPFPLLLGEQIDRDVPANRSAGLVNIGGVLRLTNQRLLFLPHAMNFGAPQNLVLTWDRVTRATFGTSAKEVALKIAAAALHHHSTGSGTLFLEHADGTDQFVIDTTPEFLERMEEHIQRNREQPKFAR